MPAQNLKPVALIGYSGHAYVVIDILVSAGFTIAGYCEQIAKEYDPFSLSWLGNDATDETRSRLAAFGYFVAIGDNGIRRKVTGSLHPVLGAPVNAIHPRSIVSASATIGEGSMIAAAAVINPLVQLGRGVVCNTSCSIDHECIIGDFSHVAPGAVLSGNVTVGENSFVGAGSVVKQGVIIGSNVIIGAGAVIIENVPDGVTIVGNPGYELKKKRYE